MTCACENHGKDKLESSTAQAVQDLAECRSMLKSLNETSRQLSKQLSELGTHIFAVSEQLSKHDSCEDGHHAKSADRFYYRVMMSNADNELSHAITETWNAYSYAEFDRALKSALNIPSDTSKIPSDFEEYADRLKPYGISEDDLKPEWEVFKRDYKAYLEVINAAASVRLNSRGVWGHHVDVDAETELDVEIGID